MPKTTRSVGRRSTRLHSTDNASASTKPDTKRLLIETAERLFGQHGLDGISLREIALAAGQANSNVVQYHFKDKAGLIGAILEYHVEHFETLRREQLQNLPANKSQRVRELLKILWLPSMTIVDAGGSHTYCRFLLHYLTHPQSVQHPISRFYNAAQAADSQQQELTSLIEATRILRDHYAKLPEYTLNRRLSALSMMFLATVVEHDNSQMIAKRKKLERFDVESVLDMAIAALNAPG